MTIGLRFTFPTALAALLLVVPTARAGSPRATVRLVVAEETAETAAVDESLPTPVVPQLANPENDGALPPPHVGGELDEPPPNPYEATSPTDSPPFDAWTGHELDPAHAYPASPHPHRPLANHLHHRPRQVPLQRESWLNRPYAASFLFGGLFLDTPLGDHVLNGDAGIMFGGRLSWDFERHWGVENRIAFAYPGLTDPTGANDYRAAHAFVWDLNWMWYFTGDTRWRPYFSAGVGALDLKYDSPVLSQHNTTFTVPFGVGLKYRHSTRMAMRIDLTDNFSLASGAQSTMHNFSILAGFEARFGGGSRRSYWPWNPGHDWR